MRVHEGANAREDVAEGVWGAWCWRWHQTTEWEGLGTVEALWVSTEGSLFSEGAFLHPAALM